MTTPSDAHADQDAPKGFASDSDYLATEISFLAARVARLMAERGDRQGQFDPIRGANIPEGPDDQASNQSAAREVDRLRAREHRLREHRDARLEAHRNSCQPTLGIDRLCLSHNLCSDERTILICTCISAICPRLHQDVMGLMAQYYSHFCVTDLIEVLAPGELGDVIQARRYFMPGSALVSEALVVAEEPREPATPDEFLGLSVRVTNKAFAIISGVSELATGKDA